MLHCRALLCLGLATLLDGCAYLHKVQLSEVESIGDRGRKISVKVSETTIDFREAGQIARDVGSFSNSRPVSELGKLAEAYSTLFQWGPKTGAPVFHELYAREIPEALAAKCKGGRIANIVSMREARQYPIVKGEIVRIDAVCLAGRRSKR
jgi:hypothetical protein